MARIEEAPLPGVGVRYTFEATSGERVSTVHHHSGRVQVYVAEADEPDRSRLVLDLDEGDNRVLAEMLGGSQVVREIDRLQQSVAGISIEWLKVPAGSPAAGRSIGDLEIRTTTGVTVVAAIRGGQTLPVPGPSFRLEQGDTLVVVGRPDDLGRIDDLLH